MFRIIPCNFWNEPDLEDWSFEEKSFYIYLMTSMLTNTAGILKYAKKHIVVDTGMNRSKIDKIIKDFEQRNEVVISETGKEIWIVRFLAYQNLKGSVWKRIEKLVHETKSKNILNKFNELYGEPKENKKEPKEPKKEPVNKPKTPERKIAENFPSKQASALIGTMKRFLHKKFPEFVDFAFDEKIMQRAKESDNPVAYVMGSITKQSCMSRFNEWKSEQYKKGD